MLKKKPSKPVIYADLHENKSNILKYLESHDVDLQMKHLKVGDYICSDRVGIERKFVTDFLSSITNQRLFKQLSELVDSYSHPLLIIEGNPEFLFSERNINPNVIRGVLAAIALDFKIPIIWTMNPRETAAQIYWIAMREQILEKRPLQIRVNKKTRTLAEQQEFLVAGLPNISNAKAKKLLKKFKTPRKVFTASEKKLRKIDGFGEKTIKRIKQVLEQKYNGG